MTTMQERCLLISLALSLVMAACGAGAEPPRIVQATATEVPGPVGRYVRVVWPLEQWLVVSYIRAGERDNALWRLRADGTQMEPMPLPPGFERCGRAFLYRPAALRHRGALFSAWCTGIALNEAHVMVWDLREGTTGRFYPHQLPKGYPADLTVASDGSMIIAASGGIEGSLFWLRPDGPSQIDLGMERAEAASLSPDGKFILFFGNRSLGTAWRVEPPHDLWLVSADCETLDGGCKGKAIRLLQDIHDPSLPSWSPDGRWVVFAGVVGGTTRGVWLRDMRTGRLTRLLEGYYYSPQWSPDGSRLVVIGPVPGENRIAKFPTFRTGEEALRYFDDLRAGRVEPYDPSGDRSALYIVDMSRIVG